MARPLAPLSDYHARPTLLTIGGGATNRPILAPLLIGTGRPPSEVAPAALASTFATSVAGVVTFTVLSLHHHGPVAPDWPTGIALGIGGLPGAYTGARIQSRLPDMLIRRLATILGAGEDRARGRAAGADQGPPGRAGGLQPSDPASRRPELPAAARP